MLDHRLLASCISIIVGSLIYFFYWNRFIAFLLVTAFRVSFWKQGSSSAWVDIGAIHFAPLAGRILLKDVRYHSSNQTVKIVKAQILWRYWIRRPTTEEDLSHARVGGEDYRHSNRSRACRIQVSFQGVEWFMYNRTAAYDNITSAMDPNSAGAPPESRRRSEDTNESRRTTTKSSGFEAPSIYPPSFVGAVIKSPPFIRIALVWLKRQLPSLDPKDLLPIGIDATKGAIVCGNRSTPSLLVAEFSQAHGTFGIVQARSKFDFYKQILSFKFQKALIRCVENEEFENPMTTTGRIVQEHIEASRYMVLPRLSYLSYRRFTKLWRHLQLHNLIPRRHSRFTSSRSSALRRSHNSLDEESPIGIESATFEYAIERKVLETPMLEVSYYADVVGKVPPEQQSRRTGLESFEIGNGDLPPEWGIDIVVRGGFFRYGPWADRQRVELQRAFFPPAYHDIEATSYLQPGDQRLWTALKVFIELRDETTLHIPFRETSKNWQWDGKVDVSRPKKREPALVHITAGDSSTISYIMPMVVGPTGYEPLLEVHLDNIVVTSSLNDIRLFTAESCRVRGELPSPLKWNGERQWTFAAALRQPVIYILRDHINMFADLGKDWVSGSPVDYYRFIPMIYAFELDMYHFELNLYVNDQNIIDKPLIRDENAILTIQGLRFRNGAQIPANIYRPEATSILFFVEAPNLSFALSLPRWNTHASNYGNRIGRVGFFRVDASYRYYAEVHEEYIEQFKLDITVRDIGFKALGWTIRYLLVMRDNYFGSFTNFSTLYEYLDKRRRGLPAGDPIELKYRKGKANMLQVEIGVSITNGQMILPAGLPGYETSDPAREPIPGDSGVGTCLILSIPELQLHFRLHDYYMEMSLNLDTISGGIEYECPEGLFFGRLGYRSTEEHFVVDGIDISANRLFGPQPRTSTYVCIWEISVGHTKATLSALEGQILAAAGTAFRLNFADMLNAPASEYAIPVEPDVTFLKISLHALHATWLAGHTALEVSFSRGLVLEMNDLAGKFHRKVTSLRVPQICVKILITASSGRHSWLEAARFASDANLDIYSAPAGWRESGRVQAEYIRTQDAITGRAKFLFDRASRKYDDVFGLHKNGLLLPRPRLSTPHGGEKRQQFYNEMADTTLDMQRRWSHQHHLSDSDGEEGISEADRDARLAQSRILTPLATSVPNPEEQSMSSGDESDNEDLTDVETSDSDWSDTDGVEDDGKWPIGQYHHIVNHYASRSLKTPSLWVGSPFILIRDVAFAGSPGKHKRGKPEQEASSLEGTVLDRSGDVDTTTFRFQCDKMIDLQLTPLIAPAIARLGEDTATNCLSAELILDALTAKFLGDFASSAKSSRNAINVDIHLSLVKMQVIQLVSCEKPSVCLPEDSELAQLCCQRATTTIDVQFNDCHIIGSIAKESHADPGVWTVTTTFHEVSIDLCCVASTHTSEPGLQGNADVDIFLSRFEGKFAPNGADIGLHGVAVDIGHSSSEYVAATGLAISDIAKHLSRTYKRWNLHASTSTQNLIYGVLDTSVDQFIIDPYSTIQPSYLVQRGRPNKLRTDPILVLLHYLRRCLREMDPSDRQAVRTSHADLEPDVLLKRLMPLLESRLMTLALDADTSNSSYQSTLERLIPSLRVPADQGLTGRRVPFAFGSLRIGRLDLAVRDPDRRLSRSRLTLTSLATSTRIRAPKLVTLNVSTSAVLSQISLRDRNRYNIRQYSASISVGDANLSILPHLMSFTQQILRVHRRYGTIISPIENATNATMDSKSTKAVTEAIHLVLTLSLQSFRVEAAAENLICVFGLSGLKLGSTILAKPVTGHQGLCDQSMNQSITFDQIFLRARSNADTSRRRESDILASLVFTDGKCNAVVRQEPLSGVILRTVLSLKCLQLKVPRSAIRLYRFIEEWRADFLPGIKATLHALLSEIERVPTKPVSPTFAPAGQKKPLVFHVHSHISSSNVSLQVMHGTWLSWDVYRIVAYIKPSTTTTRDSSRSFGLQLASQVCSVSYRPNRSREITPDTHVKLELPTLSISGRYGDSSLYTLACMEFFQLIVKPSHWDTLLVVQQKFGQDFSDLVCLAEETRRKRAAPAQRLPTVLTSLDYSGFLKMRGFRIGLEGISSTLYLECLDIGGGINNDSGRAWNIGLSDLALSLAPRASSGAMASGFNRNHRSAFVIIDFQAGAANCSSEGVEGKALRVSVTKIHAVMQPSSIGEIGDFIDHMQAEILDHKERRAAELEEFKAKTKSVMRTFEVKVNDAELPKSTWLSEYTIDLIIKNIGAAFPLALGQDLELPHTGSHDSNSVRAFLFSTKSLVFGSQRGETGQAIMKSFSFQFVSHFRQSVSSDFSGENHQTRNRLIYPEMTAQLRSDTSTSSRQISISASVSGFVLDIDSSIPDDVFSLIDVYRQGQERVTRLTDHNPRNALAPSPSLILSGPTVAKQYAALPTSSILASLTFLSGKVRVYSGSASSLSRTMSLSAHFWEPTDAQFLEFGADLFKLPVVSVWAEYRATPAAQKFASSRSVEPSTLMFKSTIHSSHNTLRPTLLPFVAEVIKHVEVRMRKTTLRISQKSASAVPDTATRATMDRGQLTPDAVSTMQINFGLRIDKSRLELTCQPDVNVIAGLHWDSGGFVVNISPGARNVTFTGSVAGLTIGLKHGFLSEECVRLDARNLAFSMQFAKRVSEDGDPVSLVSVVLDTEFAGSVRFSRLQDVLCFRATWLDRIPIFIGQQNSASGSSSKLSATSSSSPPKQGFMTAVLVRIREIQLDVDLGQSISAVGLKLTDARIRTKMTEDLYEVSLTVTDVAISAKGNISGRVAVPDCLFQTTRRKENKFLEGGGKAKMLELTMTSGPLSAVLESDQQELLHYHAKPLEVNIFDDWSLISEVHGPEEERPLRLSFIVSGAEVIAAATVGTIPKLLSYANKFKVNMDAQREGASRESRTFQMTRTPKPDNPLSDVANAMLHSVRDQFKEAEAGLSYAIEQHLSLRLNSLRLAVFPRTMADLEMAQFVGSDVHARLDRKGGADGLLVKRVLHLSFSSMSISKYSQLNHNLPVSDKPLDGNTWLALLLRGAPEAIIVGLPSMNMAMSSDELAGAIAKELLYDFNSRFVRREGMRDFEDIYITLNMSLYSWLTILRKNLSREMNQVQASSDWRTSSATAAPVITSRKKVLEPLQLAGVKEENSDSMLSRSSVTPSASPLISAAVQPHSRGPKPSSSADPLASPPSSEPCFDVQELNTPPHIPPPAPTGTTSMPSSKKSGIVYTPGDRHIERLNMRQLGEATPDVMHPFFMKKAGFNLEDSLPQYVHEYATIPIEQIMEVLLRLYSKQLRVDREVDGAGGSPQKEPLMLMRSNQ